MSPVRTATLRRLALALPDTSEAPHFDRVAFRTPRRIFATLHEGSGVANLKLTPEDQAHFSAASDGAVYPVPNKWGEQGWTSFVLKQVSRELLEDALEVAHEQASRAGNRKVAKKAGSR